MKKQNFLMQNNLNIIKNLKKSYNYQCNFFFN